MSCVGEQFHPSIPHVEISSHRIWAWELCGCYFYFLSVHLGTVLPCLLWLSEKVKISQAAEVHEKAVSGCFSTELGCDSRKSEWRSGVPLRSLKCRGESHEALSSESCDSTQLCATPVSFCWCVCVLQVDAVQLLCVCVDACGFLCESYSGGRQYGQCTVSVASVDHGTRWLVGSFSLSLSRSPLIFFTVIVGCY